MSATRRDDLVRLVGAAHDAVTGLPYDTDAVALYRRAAAHAEQVWPGALGLAVAGVLAIAAERRESTRIRGILGEHNTTLALALAVLARPLDQP